jgi:hypothetical protein
MAVVAKVHEHGFCCVLMSFKELAAFGGGKKGAPILRYAGSGASVMGVSGWRCSGRVNARKLVGGAVGGSPNVMMLLIELLVMRRSKGRQYSFGMAGDDDAGACVEKLHLRWHCLHA